MRHRTDEQRLIRVIARHARDVGALALEICLIAAGKIEPNFLFGELGARDDVAVLKLLHRILGAVHKPLALLVAEHRAVVEKVREDIRPLGRVDAVRIKLHELHAAQRQTAARGHGVAVAGHIARVARCGIHVACAAAAEDHRFGRIYAHLPAAERKDTLRAAVFGKNVADGHAVLHGDIGILVQLLPHGLRQNAALLGRAAGEIRIFPAVFRKRPVLERQAETAQPLHGRGSVIDKERRDLRVLLSRAGSKKAAAVILAQAGRVRREAVHRHGHHRIAGAAGLAFAENTHRSAALRGGERGIHTGQTAADDEHIAARPGFIRKRCCFHFYHSFENSILHSAEKDKPHTLRYGDCFSGADDDKMFSDERNYSALPVASLFQDLSRALLRPQYRKKATTMLTTAGMRKLRLTQIWPMTVAMIQETIPTQLMF